MKKTQATTATNNKKTLVVGGCSSGWCSGVVVKNVNKLVHSSVISTVCGDNVVICLEWPGRLDGFGGDFDSLCSAVDFVTVSFVKSWVAVSVSLSFSSFFAPLARNVSDLMGEWMGGGDVYSNSPCTPCLGY